MNTGVAITGMGILSPIGNTVAENLQALQNAQSSIATIEMIQTRHKEAIKVGEIKKTNQELATTLGLSDTHRFSRTAMLGAIAAKEALQEANITDIDRYKTGFISGTSVGGMDTTEQYYLRFKEEPNYRRFIQAQHAGFTTQTIAHHLGINGYVSTISTACSSAANAIMLGARMIRAGQLDRVVVGGTDALSKFTINGFNSLMILSDEVCTPFDHHRKGLNLGEAAAYLVLESDAMLQKTEKKVLGTVVGWANANDAFHQTASSANGEGAYLAMEQALAIAKLEPNAIDYINAHGTATPNNDLSEGRAMLRIFGQDSVPMFSSTKAYTGHTLAAAGAVEAVYSLLSLREQLIFPNLHFSTPMEEFSLIPQQTIQHRALQTVLSNSFGFGGNCSTLIFTN